MIALAANAAMPQVRAVVEWELISLRESLAEAQGKAADRSDTAAAAHYRALTSDIGRYLDRMGDSTEVPGPTGVPPGSPIG